MFEKFFENPNQLSNEQLKALQEEKQKQERLREEEREERQRRLQIDKIAVSVFEQLQEHLENEKLKDTQPNFKDDVVTLNVGGYDFHNEGFKFSYLLVGADNIGKTIDVDYMGIRYQLKLHEGLNIANFPPNSVIKSNEPIVVGLFRTDHKLI